MSKTTFPVCYPNLQTIDQGATADEAMRRYCTSDTTGGDIAKKMKVSRSYFSELINEKRIWTFELAEKFLAALER